MIPKVIHYCWFGGAPLNDLAKKCIASWKKFCPDYEIKEWNESNFDIASNPYVKEAYTARKWAFVSDYVRLYVLYEYGGIYLDTDVELLKNIDAFLDQPAFSGFESEQSISTAIMGSEKGGEWMEYLLSYYQNRHFILPDGRYDLKTNVITITDMTRSRYGIRLDNTYQKIDGILSLYPKDYFCPKSYETEEIKITENTCCIHHFSASWFNEQQKRLHIKRMYFINKYGVEQGSKKFSKWVYKRRYYIYMRQNGIRITLKKAIAKIKGVRK